MMICLMYILATLPKGQSTLRVDSARIQAVMDLKVLSSKSGCDVAFDFVLENCRRDRVESQIAI